jgi:hypothetical protein
MRKTSVTFLALPFVIAACGDDPEAKPDAAPAIDAMIDAPTQSSSDLVGVWIKIPSQVDETPPPPAERDRFRVNADGTFVYEEEGDDDTGTWTADAATITIMGNNGPGTPVRTITAEYLIKDMRLVWPAFLPMGAVDGAVGTWRSKTTDDGMVVTQTFQVRADMTATLQVDSDEQLILQGTWAYEVDDLVFTTMIEQTTLNLHFQEIRGVALGPLYDRETRTKPNAIPTSTIAPPSAACTGGCSPKATHVISELPIGSPKMASATKCVGVTRTAALSRLCPMNDATSAAHAHAR